MLLVLNSDHALAGLFKSYLVYFKKCYYNLIPQRIGEDFHNATRIATTLSTVYMYLHFHNSVWLKTEWLSHLDS